MKGNGSFIKTHTFAIIAASFVGMANSQLCYPSEMYQWSMITKRGVFYGNEGVDYSQLNGGWITQDNNQGINHTRIAALKDGAQFYHSTSPGNSYLEDIAGVHGQFGKVSVESASFINGITSPPDNDVEHASVGCPWVTAGPDQPKFSKVLDTYLSHAKEASLHLSQQPATHSITRDGSIESLENENSSRSDYSIVNLSPCHLDHGDACIATDATDSSPELLFSEITSVHSDGYIDSQPDNILVINVPVREHTLLIGDSMVASKLDPCKTIWNFYSVDSNNTFQQDSALSLEFALTSLFPGTVIVASTYGSVKFTNTGMIAGQLVVDQVIEENESVDNMQSHVLGYSELNYQCSNLHSCWPLQMPSISQSDASTWGLNKPEIELPIEETVFTSVVVDWVTEYISTDTSTSTVTELSLFQSTVTLTHTILDTQTVIDEFSTTTSTTTFYETFYETLGATELRLTSTTYETEYVTEVVVHTSVVTVTEDVEAQRTTVMP